MQALNLIEEESACAPSAFGGSERVSLSEVVSALSFALDLTEDAVPGHAVRSCLLGMRLGAALGLTDAALADLYYALLLKDIGCSSNAARMCQILGADERNGKRDVKLIDWTRPTVAAVKLAWKNSLPDAGLLRKVQHIGWLALTQHQHNAEMIGLRCDRGASIVRKIGLGDACAEAVRSLDEHWNGSGYPERRRGESIPMLGRILAVAQHLDVFCGEQGAERAMDTLRERSGSWFDPSLVSAAEALHRSGALWAGIGQNEEQARVLDLEPGAARTIAAEEVDRLCEAFADVVDAKSPYTFHHSLGVTDVANRLAAELGLGADKRQLVHRASLLHDLGKLRVPNSILDKPGKLDAGEWQVMREHPGLSQQILQRIPSFGAIARIAGRHHEKLDGSGYPHGLAADALSLEDRIVAVADIYGALAEDRPYRKGLQREQILEIMAKDAPHRLDGDCLDGLRSMTADLERA